MKGREQICCVSLYSLCPRLAGPARAGTEIQAVLHHEEEKGSWCSSVWGMNRGPARKARAELDLMGTRKSLPRSPGCSFLTVAPLLLSESAPFSGSLQGPFSFLFRGFSLLSNAEVPWAFALSMGVLSVQYRLTRISGFTLERKGQKSGRERDRGCLAKSSLTPL